MVAHIVAEAFYDGAIDSLHLGIALRMVGGGEEVLNSENMANVPKEPRCELDPIVVGEQPLGQAVYEYPVDYECLGDVFRCDVSEWHCSYQFGNAIGYNQKVNISPLRRNQLTQDVDGHKVEGVCCRK